MNTYSLSLYARNHQIQPGGTIIEHGASYGVFRSDAEAIGAGIERAKEKWPPFEGWVGHQCAICKHENNNDKP